MDGTVNSAQYSIKDTIDKYRVVKKLGEGGFGAVFKVKSEDVEYALKTERCNAEMRTLKMEVVVMKALKKAGCAHSCEMFDTGRFRGFNYLVMTLVGQSLQDLQKCTTHRKLSLGCALSVGLQCLEAIQNLHKIGYLHRDIKPANFAVSLDDPRRVVLLDFGMCRRYVDRDSSIRRPRWSAGFRGTVRYAAISCHISREMCRKDDLESLLYQQVEITCGHLPWRSVDDQDKVALMKENARGAGMTDMFTSCPQEYMTIMGYVDSLRYYDVPQYLIIKGLLLEALTSSGLSEFPYDWEVANQAVA